jgi:hypothetical protein
LNEFRSKWTILLPDAEAAQLVLEGVAAASAACEAGGEDHAVIGQGRSGDAVLGAGGAEGLQDAGPVTRWCAVSESAQREWSSSQVRISVSAPSASG